MAAPVEALPTRNLVNASPPCCLTIPSGEEEPSSTPHNIRQAEEGYKEEGYKEKCHEDGHKEEEGRKEEGGYDPTKLSPRSLVHIYECGARTWDWPPPGYNFYPRGVTNGNARDGILFGAVAPFEMCPFLIDSRRVETLRYYYYTI